MSQTGVRQHLRKHHTTSYFPQGRRKQSSYFPLFIAQWLLLYCAINCVCQECQTKDSAKSLPGGCLDEYRIY